MKRFMSFLVLMFSIVAVGSYAMLIEVSLNEMVAKSDLVIQGTVLDTKNIGKNKFGFETVENLIKVDQVILKGKVKPGDKIKVKTYAEMEDSASFDKGQKYLLFIEKNGSDNFIYNGLQGQWIIMKNGKFGGMGTNKTLDDVKKALKDGFKGKKKEPVFKM